MTNHTVESLLKFSDRVKAAYLDKKILSPVHFCSSSQAQPLIDIFKEVRPHDWVCSNWRSMFHALLKGIPEDELFQQYIDGRSMYVMSKEHRFLSSSIVGGMLPTALGLAMGIKMQGGGPFIPTENCLYCFGSGNKQSMANIYGMPGPESYPCHCVRGPKVYVCVGDMTAKTGLYHEFLCYANGHGLPVQVVVEDNKVSTNANTGETWGRQQGRTLIPHRYNYERTTPHVGLSTRVNF